MCNDGTRISREWGGVNLLFGIVLAENCVKMKKIGREAGGGGGGGGGTPWIRHWFAYGKKNILSMWSNL